MGRMPVCARRQVCKWASVQVGKWQVGKRQEGRRRLIEGK